MSVCMSLSHSLPFPLFALILVLPWDQVYSWGVPRERETWTVRVCALDLKILPHGWIKHLWVLCKSPFYFPTLGFTSNYSGCNSTSLRPHCVADGQRVHKAAGNLLDFRHGSSCSQKSWWSLMSLLSLAWSLPSSELPKPPHRLPKLRRKRNKKTPNKNTAEKICWWKASRPGEGKKTPKIQPKQKKPQKFLAEVDEN